MEWSLVSMIEASPHDAASAYVAVDCHKLDDLKPYIYRTSDSGKTWTKLTKGIPNGAYVHVVPQADFDKWLAQQAKQQAAAAGASTAGGATPTGGTS